MTKQSGKVSKANPRSIQKRTGSLNVKREKPENPFTVQEPDAYIYGNRSPVTVALLLGLSSNTAKKMISDFDMITLGTIGLTKDAINSLASYIGISRKYITENIFNISVKTLERKDSKTKLDKKTSSHAIEVAKVSQHTYAVFRDEEKVKRWLNKENRALNNLKPVELFDTLSGLRLVDNILIRIEEGVYS